MSNNKTLRHNIFLVQLTTAGAIFSFALSSPGRTGVLLVVPLTAFLLAARHIDYVHDLHSAARYIQNHLSPRIPGGVHFDEWLSQNPRLRGKAFSLAPLLVCYPGTSLLATASTVWYVFASHHGTTWRTGFALLWTGGLLLAGVSTWLLLDAVALYGNWWGIRRYALFQPTASHPTSEPDPQT